MLSDADDHVAEERRGALDEVEVAQRGRVEATRVDGQALDRRALHGAAAEAAEGCLPGRAGGRRRPRLRRDERRVRLDPHEAPVVGERDAEEGQEVRADDALQVDVEP